MKALQEIIDAIQQLSAEDLETLERWFYTHPFESEEEEEEDEEDLDDRVQEPPSIYRVSRERHRWSVEEYLALEADGITKHEYIDGQLFAMSGASREHHKISGNLFRAFSNRLGDGPCEAFMADFKLRLQINRKEVLYYPDVMVACGHEGMERYYLTNPKLIVEVLSPSTRKTDRREKGFHYMQVATLEEYVMVAQHRYEVTIHRRSENWEPIVLAKPEVLVEFHSIELSLPLAQIYSGLALQHRN